MLLNRCWCHLMLVGLCRHSLVLGHLFLVKNFRLWRVVMDHWVNVLHRGVLLMMQRVVCILPWVQTGFWLLGMMHDWLRDSMNCLISLVMVCIGSLSHFWLWYMTCRAHLGLSFGWFMACVGASFRSFPALSLPFCSLLSEDQLSFLVG